MKIRRISLWLLAILLLVSLAVPAFAESGDSQAKLGYVNDTAGLLTADQKNALLNRAAELSKQYQISVYIIAVEDYTKYSSASNIEDACVDIYDDYNLGWGKNRDAVIFMISTNTQGNREYRLDFDGNWANYAFPEEAQIQMEDRVLPYLKETEYYNAFNEYLNVCQECLEAAAEGNPIGGEGESRGRSFSLLFFLPGLFAAGVYAIILIAPMRTANVKTQADDYIVPGSMRLTRQSDHFLRRTVSRTPRQKDTDHHSGHSSGGGGRSYSSGSHSGRSGHF